MPAVPAGSASAGPEGFNPVSDAFVRDPGLAFAAARAQAPVFHYAPLDAWVLTRSADIEAALPDFESLCQGAFRDAPVPEAFQDRIPPGWFNPSWIALDPPAHTMPRKVAQRGFRRPRIKALEPQIEAIAHELVDAFAADGEVELMEGFCYALTTRTLLLLLGMPIEDHAFIRQLASDHVRAFNVVLQPIPLDEEPQLWGRYADAWDRFRALVEARRDSAGEDIISVMASARGEDGEPLLATDRIALHCCEIAFAGTDTTANLMANAITFLAAAPEQRVRVLADPALWEVAVEETLRRRPSVSAVPRIATRDVVFAGVTVPRGARVWLALGAAGTDAERWREPLRFDLDRPGVADHVAFGKGRHFCMGAPLARTQARIGLRVLHERLGAVEPVPGYETAFGRVPGAPSRLTMPVTFAAQRP
ncbi:MAG TPA: cytochrome P450 [Solirubrobacteraceae bacterium]|nr:cytochrome P450 [Solirubrobacteraceae bacterium]